MIQKKLIVEVHQLQHQQQGGIKYAKTKGFNKNINKLFDDYIKNKYSVDYFNENIFNEDSRDISIDLRFTSKIENKDDKSVRKFSQKSIIFKKIGNSFYITTTY